MPPKLKRMLSTTQRNIKQENKRCSVSKKKRLREKCPQVKLKTEKADSPRCGSPLTSPPRYSQEAPLAKSKSPQIKNGKKTKIKNAKELKETDISSMDVAELLALGETSCAIDFVEERDTSDSEESDFEEVKQADVNEPIIPKEGVSVTLELPHVKKKNKMHIDAETLIKRQMNKVKKGIQLLMHKVHLLCWIAHLKFVNNTINSPDVMELCISLVKSKNLYPPKYSDLNYLEGILKWYHKNIELKDDVNDSKCTGGLLRELTYQLQNKTAFSSKDFILMFIALLRILGLKARIIMSFQTIPVKPSSSELLESKNKKDSLTESDIKNNELLSGEAKLINAANKGDNGNIISKQAEEPKTKRKSSGNEKSFEANKKLKIENDRCSDIINLSTDLDAESVSGGKIVKSKNKSESNGSNRKNLESCISLNSSKRKKVKREDNKKEGEDSLSRRKSKKNSTVEDKIKVSQCSKSNDNLLLDSEDDSVFKTPKRKSVKRNLESQPACSSGDTKVKEGSDLWTEVFLEAEEKWISINVPKNKIHCINELYSRATHPVLYVIACNNDFTLKDVTKRYVPNWHSDTRKKRVDEEWWNETMKPYLPPQSAQDREEDEDITRQLSDKPLPCVISEYKDHPLYALKRHLLKFEAIYPSDAPTLGFIRGEPVYARECVVTLHSREMWYKQARVVRLKEEPYKIVKARPKFDRMTGEIKKDLPLELFGKWQTEDFIPPVAVDGKVPRNEYGNVDLFKPCMLPIGTVHLQIPALNRIARKLGIDCAPATVGFEFHSGASHPIFDGFVVCEEFKDILLDHWNKEIDESTKKNEEKKEKRVFGNWKRLIRGLLIREKLKLKYAFGENNDSEEGSRLKTSGNSGASVS